jgi:hypothetical protein
MLSNIFYIILALLVTFAGTYYISGLYFYLKKFSNKKKDIRYFEEKIKIMEEICNNQTAFQKLDPQQQKLFLENLEQYKETLSEIRSNGLD